MDRWNRLITSVAFCLVLAAPVWAEEENEIYGFPAASKEWDVFTLNYPAGRWTIETLEKAENRRIFKLTSTVNQSISLTVIFSRGLPTTDPFYENNPNMTNVAVLLPIAQKMAAGDDSKILFSTGTANLPAYSDTTSRVAILMEEENVVNMEACHFLLPEEDDQSKLAIAIVTTASQRGKVDDSPESPKLVQEAYAIVQGIEYPGLDDEEEDDDEDEDDDQ
ncbi:hypothetical protein LOC68_13335 [Blastopirellula sp. JC732]|uniref:Uncharacterized protein n=1 Tax=Blastopirellula sediminis TaxID=2894196 RepID=A0A9X1MMI4_9BACT|nr:hypothetical protein [Blastopirellula sediminis]MCC9607328.1 hypothetical protein [Blastopirellula sediminis]MCC9629379.1 hypothetical protein [Blastopirellula sediminis]